MLARLSLSASKFGCFLHRAGAIEHNSNVLKLV
jgi:hypothetical protein